MSTTMQTEAVPAVPQAVVKLQGHFRLQRLAAERKNSPDVDPDRPHCLMSRSQDDPSFEISREPVLGLTRSHSVLELTELGYLAGLERRTLHFHLSPKRGSDLRSCQQRLAFALLLLPQHDRWQGSWAQEDARARLPPFCLSRICEWTVRLSAERGRPPSDDMHWLQRPCQHAKHFTLSRQLTHERSEDDHQPFMTSSPSASSPSEPQTDGSEMGEFRKPPAPLLPPENFE
jgi:hypothetical protein